MSVLGLGRMEALWRFPLVTGMKCQAAYMERNGRRIDWEAAKVKQILEYLENAEDGSPP